MTFIVTDCWPSVPPHGAAVCQSQQYFRFDHGLKRSLIDVPARMCCSRRGGRVRYNSDGLLAEQVSSRSHPAVPATGQVSVLQVGLAAFSTCAFLWGTFFFTFSNAAFWARRRVGTTIVP